MSSENTNQRMIWLALGKLLCKLFRLNTGRAWISSLGPKGVQRLTDGSVHIKAARSIAMGFAYPNGDPVTGACDLPGWTEVKITPEMVGHVIPVFTSMEIKSGTGKPTTDQLNWRDQVQAAGGIAGIVRSPDEAIAVINDWHNKFKQSQLL